MAHDVIPVGDCECWQCRNTRKMKISATTQVSELPAVRSGEWLDGVGVIGWKRVMSPHVFKTEAEAQAWAKENGIKDPEYLKAYGETPSNVAHQPPKNLQKGKL